MSIAETSPLNPSLYVLYYFQQMPFYPKRLYKCVYLQMYACVFEEAIHSNTMYFVVLFQHLQSLFNIF